MQQLSVFFFAYLYFIFYNLEVTREYKINHDNLRHSFSSYCNLTLNEKVTDYLISFDCKYHKNQHFDKSSNMLSTKPLASKKHSNLSRNVSFQNYETINATMKTTVQRRHEKGSNVLDNGSRSQLHTEFFISPKMQRTSKYPCGFEKENSCR